MNRKSILLLLFWAFVGQQYSIAQSFEDFLAAFPQYEVGDKVYQGELLANMQQPIDEDLLKEYLFKEHARYLSSSTADSLYAENMLEKYPYWCPVMCVRFDDKRTLLIIGKGAANPKDSIFTSPLPPNLEVYSFRNDKLVDLGYTKIYLGHRSNSAKLTRVMQLRIDVYEDELGFDEYVLEIPDIETYKNDQVAELLAKDPYDIEYSSWNAFTYGVNRKGKLDYED